MRPVAAAPTTVRILVLKQRAGAASYLLRSSRGIASCRVVTSPAGAQEALLLTRLRPRMLASSQVPQRLLVQVRFERSPFEVSNRLRTGQDPASGFTLVPCTHGFGAVDNGVIDTEWVRPPKYQR